MEGGRILNTTALQAGTIILAEQYQVLRLLHQRPRVNVYLGKRLSAENATLSLDAAPVEFVAIRELVLTGLSTQMCSEIEQAAFEEFVSPLVPGSPRLPGAVERVYSEGSRQYLVMHLGVGRGGEDEPALNCLTLDKLLVSWREWPFWLQQETVLSWVAQLCRIVARLHRIGVVLGDLDPTMVLVDGEGVADWVPMLLISWPPAPQYLPHHALAGRRYQKIFPCAKVDAANAFAAPEMLNGVGDARSDVYSLGAILYLLLTRYAPIAAARRLGLSGDGGLLECIELIAPYQLSRDISVWLSKIVLRALALEPEQRYASAFELAEAIERMMEAH